MSSARKLPTDVLPLMAAAFPQTFFVKSHQVRPLKVDIHRDLPAILPEGITPALLKRFLYWYTRRPAYLKALAAGKTRVDLSGADAGDIDDAIRQWAQEYSEAHRDAQWAAVATATPQPGTHVPARAARAAPALSINLEDLYAMAVAAKLEITLKFSTLPNAKPAGQGKQVFALKTPDGQFVTVEVGNKVWNKLVKAAEDWPQWTAALSGVMGPRTARGFQLLNAGLQVFERKPKAPAEAAPLVEAKPVPAAVPEPPPVAATVPPSPTAPPAPNPDPLSPPIGKPKLSLKSRAKAG